MTTRRIRGAPGALAMLTLLAYLVAAPAHAGVASASGDGDEGYKKVIAYGHCAVTVFLAVTPYQWVVSLLDCARQFMDEPPIPWGGGR